MSFCKNIQACVTHDLRGRSKENIYGKLVTKNVEASRRGWSNDPTGLQVLHLKIYKKLNEVAYIQNMILNEAYST